MTPLDLSYHATRLGTYPTLSGTREVIMLELPSGLWLFDESPAGDIEDDDERLIAAALTAKDIAREIAHRYLTLTRDRHQPLAPSVTELAQGTAQRRRRAAWDEPRAIATARQPRATDIR